LYVYEIRHLDAKTVSEYEKHGAASTFSQAKPDGKTPPGLLRLFALYENLTRFNMPFCTQLPDREPADVPITMSTNIVDVSGVGLKQFWNLKSHMQSASQLATAHYPETLDRIFIIGAPFFFGTVWGWIKRWFDPITVSKIFILNAHEVKPTLESFIELRNIPKKYGGELDYEWGRLGVPDPQWEGVVQWENGHSKFPTGPLLWEDSEDGTKLSCIAYGYQDGKPRHETICTIPKTFDANGTPISATNGPVPEAADTAKLAPSTGSTTAVPTPAHTTEGTQTSGNALAQSGNVDQTDDAAQTDDSVLKNDPAAVDSAFQKLTVDDEKSADKKTTNLPPVVPTTVV
jgi:hypothetical protein